MVTATRRKVPPFWTRPGTCPLVMRPGVVGLLVHHFVLRCESRIFLGVSSSAGADGVEETFDCPRVVDDEDFGIRRDGLEGVRNES